MLGRVCPGCRGPLSFREWTADEDALCGECVSAATRAAHAAAEEMISNEDGRDYSPPRERAPAREGDR